MKKMLIIIIAVLFANLTAKGQNLFLIGEKSYPCTNAITLESNTEYSYDDLDVFLAKDGKSGLFTVSRKVTRGEEFTGKLIIYLEDGNVLTCNESAASEKVDDRAKALFNLTADQMDKLKTSNIHTVKYTMGYHYNAENFSASNKGVKTSALISEFFNQTEKSSDIVKLSEEAEPLTSPEQMPTFPNGEEAMYKYINDILKYPAIAKENGISGNVIVQFVVSVDGEVHQAKVVRGIGGGCNEEALRIVNSMPKWNPGKHDGRNVAVLYTLSIKFVYQT